MIGISWTEMLVIGVFALIFIGPKELPAMMQRIGKVVGAVRRMGSEFQREINRTTGLDQVTDLRRSITEPLKKTTAEIAREFNKITPTGVEPTGAIKPADPKSESVVNEIKAAAGLQMTTPPPPPTAAEAMKAAVQGAVVAETPVKTGPVKATRTRKPATVTNGTEVPAKPRAPRKRTVTVAEGAAPAEAPPKPVRRRAAPKSAAAAEASKPDAGTT